MATIANADGRFHLAESWRMTRGQSAVLSGILVALFAVDSSAAQSRSGIAGRVMRQDGSPLAGVMVLLRETGDIQYTAADGRYRFFPVKPGSYTLLLSLGGYSVAESARVSDGPATLLETRVDWPLTFVESLVVTAASRQIEPIAEAPAAVTTLDSAEIARQSASGQLPLLLAAAPGIHVVQSGLYDFNVNARGFNDMVNRRVRTEIDGREASMPQVMGYTDWASLAFGLGEVEQIEFVRGPGGALYGVGALNGVLSIRTKAPADSLGGKARVTFGGLDTRRVDARHAAALGGGWYFKALGGYQRAGDFARSRNDSVEYAPAILRPEAVPLVRNRTELAYGSVRVDKDLASGSTVVVEGGTVSKEGQITLTNLGRYQATDSTFPWVRSAFQSTRWNMSAAYTSASIQNQVGLSSGGGTFQAAYNLQLDTHTNRSFAAGHGRWLGGVSYSRQRVDSADPQGVQTNYEHPETADSGSLFGQIDYRLTARLKAALAGRLDASTLSRTTVSPRAAVIYEIRSGQRARLAFSRAYKAPTIAERRLRAPIAPAVDLSALEQALAPVLGSTRLGFGSIPLLAVGNDHLDVEEITSVEVGYNVLVAGRTFLQATYYRNQVNTFTSGLLPQVGTSLGRLNPSFGAYRPPGSLSAAAAAAVNGALAAALPPILGGSLSNLPDGSPVFAVLSLANFGKARTQGVELNATAHLKAGWRLDASYALFDFKISDDPPDVPLLPNTPRHQAAVGAAYVTRQFDAGLRYRWVDGFEWVSGVYAGPVPSYGVADLQVNYPVTPRLTLGVDVANLFDHAHYEMFGGDLLRRRALAHATVSW
jgi:iron complex outermembrane receptor protein